MMIGKVLMMIIIKNKKIESSKCISFENIIKSFEYFMYRKKTIKSMENIILTSQWLTEMSRCGTKYLMFDKKIYSLLFV